MRPLTRSPHPPPASLSVSFRFFVVIVPAVDRQERRRHRWASRDCLYSQADMDTLHTFFAQVHGRQETFLFHDCVCRFESERVVVRQLTTVAYRLQPIRIVSLTY
jgi:hypothetical protein